MKIFELYLHNEVDIILKRHMVKWWILFKIWVSRWNII